MGKRTTIGDVAAAAGVSVATVSRVLNGGAVKGATATRVWDAANRLDYTPNALTKSIFAGKSSTIGVLIDDLSSPFYLDLMRGIDEVADANGSLVMFSNTFRHVDREVAQVQTMDEQRVRGLIVTTSVSTDDRTRRMAARGTPCVVVARSVQSPLPNLHSVALDNRAAGRLVAEHLVSCGRRTVGVITSGKRPSQSGRTEGLQRGLAEAGLPLPDEAVVAVAGNEDVDAAIEVLLERCAPDAIVCFAGRRTVAVHSALMARGLMIPDDIGFLTMDDFSWAPALGITVIAQPSYQMGLKAAGLIVESPAESAQLTFQPELIARTSCGERG
ncbi:LacI family DNA-binding transcriptional regulator [Streptomyces sp. NBC_01716]|uniref:LacI family DNA-binding transcriptional regulator n=1 Tax=Streptomyces sp. NBC_01716 TaxID=2975917 RepID=UPI002E326287|nr:LacI family DNA-binding transcriptional regulator [Streptomyces sp. NBC_01716]